ncbi:MAG TPA: 30S ribosomal protein S4 [Firmicutes bacterium]|nr:MAG: 30S ribosomal protein S4 [Candidatus Coatesbacteria bacterium]RLC41697.1 MAG: 30S ribosomal protein S4 [Candidatus Coatesbacteria bacterium]RLC43226.1 MAG: 30S ribosomal protein S4 [Candidatus Coatesbacteria bacterium]HDM43556.1 30S ribosomal protein S4 [Bacillota bacterium]HEC79817.1 30S ribosomal protein S4 [Bacillota bacterium]
MARYKDARCRLCRREGKKLFLKGERCLAGVKCPFDRQEKPKAYPPGDHGFRRTKYSNYGIQLREKQKVRRIYGVLEKQFRRYFSIAERRKGMTGENLLRILESRLDNIVYRLGFATSRAQARQLVSHGHILVNDKKVNIPSYLVKEGDVIAVKEKSRNHPFILRAMEIFPTPSVKWLVRKEGEFEGRVDHLPEREEIPVSVEEHLVVEFYSKV